MSKENIKLRELQKEILQILDQSDCRDSQHVVSDEKLPSRERLYTYKRSSFLKPYSCLSDDFQVTKSILGDDLFDKVIREYLIEHPANTHFINECGRSLPSFISSYIEKSLYPFIKDLSQLEWLRTESFYDFFNYKNLAQESGNLLINPSIKKMESVWPLDKIWHEEIEFLRCSSFIFIWTTEDRAVHVQSWPVEEFRVIEAILASADLDEAIDLLMSDFSEEKLTDILTQNLASWIQIGLFELKN